MKKQAVKITKKQLKACHLYIADKLLELGLQHWRTGMDLENDPSVKEKSGKVHIDVRKLKSEKQHNVKVKK